MTKTFDQLGLSQPVLQALDMQGYTKPTPIQEQAIPLVLEGRDLMGIAQTGTGKTAAFMLPSIDRLREADNQTPFKSCRLLILAPTRELAGQIAKSAKDYGAMAGLKVDSIVGGTSVNKDRNKLHRGTDILVATPGRLLDLIDQKAFKLDKVETLILDEADQMLDLGFIHALKKIAQLVPKDRQTLMFSATMPKSIKDLASQYLRNPSQVSVAPQATTAERVDQFAMLVNQDEKQALLGMILSGRYPVEGDIDLVLIFTRTKHGADRVVKKLAQDGIKANAIHGNKSQPQRLRALDEFRRGKVPVLVATDVAARGIDIPGVSHVINYELPNVSEQYVHRIGRTARAGADGVALSFASGEEYAYLRDIEKTIGMKLTVVPTPEGFSADEKELPPIVPGGRGRPQRGGFKAKPASDGANAPGRQPRRKKHPGKPRNAGKPRRHRGSGGGEGGGQRGGGQRGQGGGAR